MPVSLPPRTKMKAIIPQEIILQQIIPQDWRYGCHTHENHGNKHNKSVASAEIVLLLAGLQAIYTSLRPIPELKQKSSGCLMSPRETAATKTLSDQTRLYIVTHRLRR